jgi:hypothetical protein
LRAAGQLVADGALLIPGPRATEAQTALARLRLAQAAKAGCELITMGAEPGSTSHRNAERLGFRVAYTKVVFLRDPH